MMVGALLMIVLIGFRFEVGADWPAYGEMFFKGRHVTPLCGLLKSEIRVSKLLIG